MVSVIIPLYNKEKNIANTLHSVLQQTEPRLEILVVDDGSTDNSLQVVKQFNDSRIKILTKTNGGVSSARNLGIQTANYNFLAFLDGDDLWREDHIETLLNLFKKYDEYKIVCAATSFVKVSGNFSDTEKDNASDFLIKDYLKANSSPNEMLSSSSFMIKKDAVKVLYNTQIKYGEDVEFWYNNLKDQNIAKSSKVTAYYVTDADNRSDVHLPPLEKRFHLYDFKNASPDEKKYLGKLVALMILDYGMKKDFATVRRVAAMYSGQLPYAALYFSKLAIKKIKN